MTFVRSIGRWTMTALVINIIIGGGIFGLPSELTRLLGRASPIAMMFSAVHGRDHGPITEVASQFSEPGGPYLYVRTAFGRFLGTQMAGFTCCLILAGSPDRHSCIGKLSWCPHRSDSEQHHDVG
jgi:amino acid transporter